MPACVFTTDFDRNQQVFFVDVSGNLIYHWWDHQANRWTGPIDLGGGWVPSSTLVAAQDSAGTYQVWGDRTQGGVAQCYWSGRAWVVQPL